MRALRPQGIHFLLRWTRTPGGGEPHNEELGAERRQCSALDVAERLGETDRRDPAARGRPGGRVGETQHSKPSALQIIFFLCREHTASPKISPNEHVSVDFTRI